MLFVGYLLGVLNSGLFLSLGFYLSRSWRVEKIKPPVVVVEPEIPIFPKRPVIRKPKSLSERELWRKEQVEAPLDPSNL